MQHGRSCIYRVPYRKLVTCIYEQSVLTWVIFQFRSCSIFVASSTKQNKKCIMGADIIRVCGKTLRTLLMPMQIRARAAGDTAGKTRTSKTRRDH